jgi:hypothetical protein
MCTMSLFLGTCAFTYVDKICFCFCLKNYIDQQENTKTGKFQHCVFVLDTCANIGTIKLQADSLN